MKRAYTRKLETPIGTFYLDYRNNLDNTIHSALLDSDKKFITNIYHKETIKELKNIQSIGDIVDILALQNCTWGQSIDELTDEINFVYFSCPESKEDRFSVDDLKNYDFLNKVGTTYFVIDFE